MRGPVPAGILKHPARSVRYSVQDNPGCVGVVVAYILGASGSGKTTLRRSLAVRLPSQVVMDWDDLMEPASALARKDIRTAPETWPAYRSLVRAVVELAGVPVVLLGVCTPTELDGWPIERWLLLDCDDDERRRRLAGRPLDIEEAIADAAHYRVLGLETIDSTGLSPTSVADLIAAAIELAPER